MTWKHTGWYGPSARRIYSPPMDFPYKWPVVCCFNGFVLLSVWRSNLNNNRVAGYSKHNDKWSCGHPFSSPSINFYWWVVSSVKIVVIISAVYFCGYCRKNVGSSSHLGHFTFCVNVLDITNWYPCFAYILWICFLMLGGHNIRQNVSPFILM